MSVEENKRRYRQFVEEVLNNGRLDLAEQFLQPDFVDNTPQAETLQDFKNWLRAFRAAFPDARWEINLLVGEGDYLAHHKTLHGTHLGEFMGLAPTGKPFTYTETVLVRFENGRMAEFWGEFDAARFAAQLRDA